MKAYVVSLTARGNAVRPSFGAFLWSNKHSRYIWRGELATTMGQLAELVMQAAAFLRNQQNWFEELQVVEVEAAELSVNGDQLLGGNPDNQQPVTNNPVAPEQPDDWASQKAALLDTIEQLQATVRLLSETSGRKPSKKLMERLAAASNAAPVITDGLCPTVAGDTAAGVTTDTAKSAAPPSTS